MKKEKLIRNMMDQIKEAQLKLGYVRETVRLYYPPSSLRALLETETEDGAELAALLTEAFAGAEDFGNLTFGLHRGNVEVTIPPEGVEYVHREVAEPPFLSELIHLFQMEHSCSLEAISRVFEKYGTFVCEKMPEEMDFDYVLHFEDGAIDDYYYCIRMEMGHTIYHRFTKTDYAALL